MQEKNVSRATCPQLEGDGRTEPYPDPVKTRISLLTVTQVSQRLGVSTSVVYGLCANRQLRHERHGLRRGKILIPEDALEEYRRARTVAVRTEGEPERPSPAREPVKLQHLRLKTS
jgi:excisionase family DNA binding protein